MQLTQYLAQLWQAVTSPPNPEQMRQRLLREAQFEQLKALAAAEDHHVQMEAHHKHADMLAARITRLSGGDE
jgi:hypothetical protein